jgi:cysteinyl-tRNA synthetase
VLQIYNTLTRKKEEFRPITPGKINMYVCGMTVYDYCHLGHARVLVAFDVIVRYLRSSGYDVTYVRNITDIDDKILRRAAERGIPYEQLTHQFIEAMHEDEARLGVLRPTLEPRATQHVADIIALTQRLIDAKYAYPAVNGDVYYAVAKFADYGKLSGKKPDELLAGARIEIDEAKKDPRDFALWKAAKPNEEAVWDSPWGPGRPGWHIECSAMSGCCLGDTFDIHGGGPDLKFPHHENEIAQSEAATGKTYVNYWMHAGPVRVDGEKMSKSLGNFFTIREILDQYNPEVVRFLLISSHYRSEIDYSDETLQDARSGLDRFYRALDKFDSVEATALEDLHGSEYYERFIAAMDDDFNTREALAVLFDLVRAVNSEADLEKSKKLAASLKGLGALFGILQQPPRKYLQEPRPVRLYPQAASLNIAGGVPEISITPAISNEEIEALVAERIQAKLDKNFARSDQIRDELKAKGIILEDSKGATTWRRE